MKASNTLIKGRSWPEVQLDGSAEGIGSAVAEEPAGAHWGMADADRKMENGSCYVDPHHTIGIGGLSRATGQIQNNQREERRLWSLLVDIEWSLLHMEGHPKKEALLQKMAEEYYAYSLWIGISNE